MKKKIVFLMFLFFSFSIVYALSSQSFTIDLNKLNRNKNIAQEINETVDNKYNISYQIEEDQEQKKVELATRKVAYLLLGDENTKLTADSYLDRKDAFIDMFYQPEIPKDKDGNIDYDSKEFTESAVAGFSYSLFKNIVAVNPTYQKLGQPIIIKGEGCYYATIAVKGFEHDDYNMEDPMTLTRATNDVIFYFKFKKLDGEYKLAWSQAHYSEDTDKYFNDFSSQEASTSYNIEMDFEDISDMFDFSKLNKISDKEFKRLYDSNKKTTVMLNSYYRNNIVNTANGFYLRKGLVVTTWSFVQKSLQDSQYISITDSENKNHILDGIVYINEDIDMAILKQKDETGVNTHLASYKDLKTEDPIFTISSKLGYNLKLSKGIYVSSTNEMLKNVLTLTENDQGSALYNMNGEIVGMNTNKLLNNNFSNAISTDLMKNLQKQLINQNFKDIKSIRFDDLKEKYFYNNQNEETIKNNVKDKTWKKYKKIGNIEENIHLELVKANYKNKTMSLRYKNSISDYMSSMSLSKSYRDQLIKDGYKEKVASKNKYIYQNKEYKVIITDEFDYLIIVIMEI